MQKKNRFQQLHDGDSSELGWRRSEVHHPSAKLSPAPNTCKRQTQAQKASAPGCLLNSNFELAASEFQKPNGFVGCLQLSFLQM